MSRARWSAGRLTQALVSLVLTSLYGLHRPARLCWAVDLIAREKASAQKIPGITKTRRARREEVDRSRSLWGHRHLVVGLLHRASVALVRVGGHCRVAVGTAARCVSR